MTVAELIELLNKQPQDLQVAYKCYSEQLLLESSDISVVRLSEPRPDGWVQDYRKDIPSQEYLLFPGN